MKQGKSIVDIAKELERQLETRKDYLAREHALQVVPVALDADSNPMPEKAAELEAEISDVALTGINGKPMLMTEVAHDQIAARLEIPRKYYDRMREEEPKLLANNINTWLAKGGDKRMVRTLDGKVRAFLSDRYRPLDNYDLANVAFPALQEAKAQIVSCEITESRLYIKAIFPELSGEVPEGLQLGEGHNFLGKDTVVAAVYISNSEVGAGSLRVDGGCFKTRCTNLMQFAAGSMKKYHIGRTAASELDSAVELFTDETKRADDQAFWLKVRDVIKASCNEEFFRAQLEKMAAAAKDVIYQDDLPNVVEVTRKQLGLGEGLQNGILKHLIQGGDLTRWGLLNAVTRTAEDQESYDNATDLERAGGKILELAERDWQQIAGKKKVA